ncbi:hypothetical protein HanIR_Chr11g0529351 [Helianthus annuus]|nr:hypothetical protein HanIR_Chr11g0529351 [Helianthus annuus]
MAAPHICQEQRRSMRLKLRVSKPTVETPPCAQRTVFLRCEESKLQTRYNLCLHLYYVLNKLQPPPRVRASSAYAGHTPAARASLARADTPVRERASSARVLHVRRNASAPLLVGHPPLLSE